MEIICDECQSKFRIQDDKIPADKTVTATCPKCQNKISISRPQKKSQKPSFEPEEDSFEPEFDDTYDSDEDPFDFVEEEGHSALICEINPELSKTYKDGLALLEYHITEAENTRDALTKLRYHTYDLVVVNEKFGVEVSTDNSVLVYLQRLPMTVRRNIFVAMISDNIRTKDHMMAFNRSVNLIINIKNLPDFNHILKRALAENDLFFKIFNETLKEEGRY